MDQSPIRMRRADEDLIVALDVDRVEQARELVRKLDGVAGFFKVGMGLQLDPEMNRFLRELVGQGKRVFLDYKYLDIEATMERAVRHAAALGVSFLTVHHANRSIFEAALRGRDALGASSELKLLMVTVLTSVGDRDLAEMGFAGTVEELVLRRARQAAEWGMDGVIASGREAALIRAEAGERLAIVTPGIRPVGYPGDDQKRRVTPAGAIAAGVDYLVVGRPIVEADDPRAAAAKMLEEMQQAFEARARVMA